MKHVIGMSDQEFKDFQSEYYVILGKLKPLLSDHEHDVLSEGLRNCVAMKAYVDPRVKDAGGSDSEVKAEKKKEDNQGKFITAKIYFKNTAELMAVRTKLEGLGYRKEGAVTMTAGSGKDGGYIVTNKDGKYTFTSDLAKYQALQLKYFSAEKIIKTGVFE